MGLYSALISGVYPELQSFTDPGTRWERIPYVPGIEINAVQGPFRFKPNGSTSKRIKEGDVIGYDCDFPLLSPVTGLAEYIQEKNSFLLRLEGNLKIGNSALPDEQVPHRLIANAPDPRGEFIRRICGAGIASLDYSQGPLHLIFEKVLASKNPLIILSLLDPSGAFGWQRILGQRFIFLQQFLKDIFSAARIVTVVRPSLLHGNVRNPVNYGKSLPPVIIRKIRRDVSADRPEEEQGVAYIGPHTLFALGEYLYDGKSFTSHLAAFLFNRLANRATRIFRLPNGFPIASVIDEFDRKSTTSIFTGNMFNGPRIDGKAPGHYSIYGNSVYYCTGDQKAGKGAMRACSGCIRCNSICPVGANPHALLYKPQLFRKDLCVRCGLCDFVCESGIAITERMI